MKKLLNSIIFIGLPSEIVVLIVHFIWPDWITNKGLISSFLGILIAVISSYIYDSKKK